MHSSKYFSALKTRPKTIICCHLSNSNAIADRILKAMNKYFNWKFDVISCHFAFHYFLADEIRFQQTLDNINKLLNVNGYVIMTLFDGQRVHEYIEKEGKDGVVENYVDVKGIRTLVHSITKKYDINDKSKVEKNGNNIMFKETNQEKNDENIIDLNNIFFKTECV